MIFGLFPFLSFLSFLFFPFMLPFVSSFSVSQPNPLRIQKLNEWIKEKKRTIDRLIGWMIACFLACLLTRLIDWLIDWLIDDWLSDWLTDWLIDWLIDWLSNWLIDWLTDWLTYWLTDRSIDWLIDGFIDWFIEWLIDWLIDWLTTGFQTLTFAIDNRISPGIGFAMIMVSFLVSIYYNVMLAWSIYYLYHAFKTDIPWVGCHHAWNTDQCYELYAINVTNSNMVSPSKEFFT